MPRAGDLLDRPKTAGDLLDEPDEPPAFEFGGGRSRGRGGGGTVPRGTYTGAPDDPLIPEYPLENVAALLPGGRLARGAASLVPRAPALARSALANAAGSAGFGLVEGTASGRNPLPKLPEYAATGAILGPAAERGAGLLGRGLGAISRRLRPARAPRVQADFEMTPTPVARNAAPVPESAPTVTTVTPSPVPRQPFTGESAQQQIEPLQAFHEQLQKDPAYLARLRELGGGREHTNPETIAKALQEGPIPPQELAAWAAETPTNAVQQTRGLLTKDFFQQRWKRAIEQGDAAAARDNQRVLAAIEPGVQNLRATPGRALQAQAMFVQDRVTAEIEKLADLQAKGVPLDQMREAIAASRKSLSRQGLIGRATARFTDAIRAFEMYATAAKLTSPVTHAVNTVSNALTVGLVRPVEKTLAAGGLAAQGKPAEALSKLQALYGTSTGFQSGVRRWSEAMFGDVVDIGKAETQRGLPFKGKARLLDPFRQLAAADAFWKGILEDSEIHQRAFASAYQQGLRGRPLAARVADLVNDPPSAWLDQARATAREFTFQEDPDGFLKAVSKLRDIPGARLIVPFIQTPYNIAKFQAQRSPMGVASGRNLRGIAEGGEKQAEALARIATGTAFSLAAYFTVLRGEVTGAYPSDKAEREVWEAEGRKPYSVKVGPRWLAYNRFQPVGLYLGQAAALKDALDAGNERGAAALFGKMTASAGKQMLDLPFVQGMSGLMDALQDPEHFGERFISQTATGFVPNILRDVRQQTDSAQREAKGIVPSLENMLPGVSQRLPQKVDVLGRAIDYDPNRLARASKVLTLPRTSPETEALRTRLEERKPPRQVAPADRAEFERERRTAAGAALNMVIRQDGFDALPPDQQARLIDRALESAHRTVTNRWKERGKFAATGGTR